MIESCSYMSSQNRFGYEWDRYAEMTSDYEGQFRNWTHPLTPEDWKGKRILDGGCGMGRNSYWPLKWGASSSVAFDFDERSVARAKETLKDFPNAEVRYKSIYDIDWKNEFESYFRSGSFIILRTRRKHLPIWLLRSSQEVNWSYGCIAMREMSG